MEVTGQDRNTALVCTLSLSLSFTFSLSLTTLIDVATSHRSASEGDHFTAQHAAADPTMRQARLIVHHQLPDAVVSGVDDYDVVCWKRPSPPNFVIILRALTASARRQLLTAIGSTYVLKPPTLDARR